MSQHIFQQTIDGKAFEIQIGWDKPCQRFYGVVSTWVHDDTEYCDGYWDDDQPVWSNLHHTGDLTLDAITREIGKLGIKIPERILQYVLIDQRYNIVNRRALHVK